MLRLLLHRWEVAAGRSRWSGALALVLVVALSASIAGLGHDHAAVEEADAHQGCALCYLHSITMEPGPVADRIVLPEVSGRVDSLELLQADSLAPSLLPPLRGPPLLLLIRPL